MNTVTIVLALWASFAAGVHAHVARQPNAGTKSGSVAAFMLSDGATDVPDASTSVGLSTDAAAEAVSDSIRNLFGLPRDGLPMLVPVPAASVPLVASQFTSVLPAAKAVVDVVKIAVDNTVKVVTPAKKKVKVAVLELPPRTEAEKVNKQYGSFGKMLQAKGQARLDKELNKQKEDKQFMESVAIPHMEAAIKKANAAVEAKEAAARAKALAKEDAKRIADGLVPVKPPMFAAAPKVLAFELLPLTEAEKKAGAASRPETKKFESFGKMLQAKGQARLDKDLIKQKEDKQYMESVAIPHMEAAIKKAGAAVEAKEAAARAKKLAKEDAKRIADGLVPVQPPMFAAAPKVKALELAPMTKAEKAGVKQFEDMVAKDKAAKGKAFADKAGTEVVKTSKEAPIAPGGLNAMGVTQSGLPSKEVTKDMAVKTIMKAVTKDTASALDHLADIKKVREAASKAALKAAADVKEAAAQAAVAAKAFAKQKKADQEAERRQHEHSQDRANEAMRKANEKYAKLKPAATSDEKKKSDANSEVSTLLNWDEQQKTIKQNLPAAIRKLMRPTTNLNQGSEIDQWAQSLTKDHSMAAIVEHAMPVPAPVQDAQADYLSERELAHRNTEPVFATALMQQESAPVATVATMTMVPSEITPFQPMKLQEEKEKAQPGLLARFSHWFWAEPWDDEVVAKDVPKPEQAALVQVSKEVTMKQDHHGIDDYDRQDVEATAEAAARDSLEDVNIVDPWAAMEQEDEKVVEHVKREQRALHAEALKVKPVMPSPGVDHAGSTHISGFFKGLASEDEAMISSLDRSKNSEDLSEYSSMVQMQNAQVESADHATSYAKSKHLRT